MMLENMISDLALSQAAAFQDAPGNREKGNNISEHGCCSEDKNGLLMIVYSCPEQLAALFFWHRACIVCLAFAVAFAVPSAFFVSSLLLLDSFFKAWYLFRPIYGFM